MEKDTTITPEVQPTGLKPHRGTVVLVLGILGLVCCLICGIVAWVMGNADLAEMDAGTMDPEGRGLTKAGKICGIVSVIIAIGMLLLWLAMMVLGGIGAAVSS